MTRMGLLNIKARLAAIGPMARQNAPQSIKRAINEDMPKLIRIAELAESLLSEDENWTAYNVGTMLAEELESLDVREWYRAEQAKNAEKPTGPT